MIRSARYGVAFTGAGISVDSGIPTFRGDGGLWNTVDPIYLEIGFFKKKPLQSWKVIKEIFYDKFSNARPNIAHEVLARMGERGFIESVVTQNIDHLHQLAGSKPVYELHGSYRQLVCTACNTEYDMSFADLNFLPPTCYICKGILKPDIVFFNEPIHPEPQKRSLEEAEKCDLLLIIGTDAEVYPANAIPVIAHSHGARIIEVNIRESHLTRGLTDLFICGRAGEVMSEVGEKLYL